MYVHAYDKRVMHNARQCTNCNGVEPIDTVSVICGTCGNGTFVTVFISEYWFDLAESFGYSRTASAAVLVREFFDVWNVKEYPSFSDFMRAEVLA